MSKHLLTLAAVLFSPIALLAQQGKSNDQIAAQIRSLGVEKEISVTFDSSGGTSRIKAVTENFKQKETDAAGLMAMNFALGSFYPGSALQTSPERLMLSMWAMSKRPRFADDHKLVVELGGEAIDLGQGRYTPKPQQNMEYLNYEITRQDLASIAGGSGAVFRIGKHAFTLTSEQLKVIKALVNITDVNSK
ncbi:MAG: hypothetical protein ACK4S4_02300 [Pyrinomonadaceae bacterium]